MRPDTALRTSVAVTIKMPVPTLVLLLLVGACAALPDEEASPRIRAEPTAASGESATSGAPAPASRTPLAPGAEEVGPPAPMPTTPKVDSLAEELSRLKSFESSTITQSAAPTKSTKPVIKPALHKRNVHDDEDEEEEDEDIEDEDEEEGEEEEEEEEVEEEEAEEAQDEDEEEEEYDEDHEEDEEEEEDDEDTHHDKRSRRKTKRKDNSMAEEEEVEVKRESHEVKDPSPEEQAAASPRGVATVLAIPSVQRPWEIATDLDERSSKYAKVDERGEMDERGEVDERREMDERRETDERREEDERGEGTGEVKRRSPRLLKKVYKKKHFVQEKPVPRPLLEADQILELMLRMAEEPHHLRQVRRHHRRRTHNRKRSKASSSTKRPSMSMSDRLKAEIEDIKKLRGAVPKDPKLHKPVGHGWPPVSKVNKKAPSDQQWRTHKEVAIVGGQPSIRDEWAEQLKLLRTEAPTKTSSSATWTSTTPAPPAASSHQRQRFAYHRVTSSPQPERQLRPHSAYIAVSVMEPSRAEGSAGSESTSSPPSTAREAPVKMWADIAAAAAAADADRWRPGAYEEQLVDLVAQQQKQHRFGWNKWAKSNDVQRGALEPPGATTPSEEEQQRRILWLQQRRRMA